MNWDSLIRAGADDSRRSRVLDRRGYRSAGAAGTFRQEVAVLGGLVAMIVAVG